jgi:hypothetical protein
LVGVRERHVWKKEKEKEKRWKEEMISIDLILLYLKHDCSFIF